ncbi:MAG TPA: AraC family transcriptional regulator [Burkholderiales bacterium]|nr:AraC family transcriptional regulator [Burkholderiales bacterium]
MAVRHDAASAKLAQPSVANDPAAGDPLSDVLRAVKLSGALFFLVDASSPWGVKVPTASDFSPIILPRARHVVSYHVVTEGEGWASVPGAPPVRFAAGDVIVFPHGDPYAMLSAPGGPAEFDFDGALDFFRAMAAGQLPFVVPEGGGGAGRARFMCGFLGCDARPFNPLLAALPRLMRVQRPASGTDGLLDRLIGLTLAEARTRRPGGEAIRLRLSELMFVEVVRQYLEALPAEQTGWLAGLRDPGIGRALSLLHERPAHPWTLEELASRSALSRSVLAERFTRLVGQPPMQYLTCWRVQVAARLLADGGAKIAAVGHEVGYSSEAAFSRTFKRVAGESPAAWRARFS